MSDQAVRNQLRLVEAFVRIGDELASDPSIETVLHTISHRALELIPSAEHAAISRGRHGKFETVAATSELPMQVDRIQYARGSGPCVDAILRGSPYRVGDLSRATTWPEFGREAAQECGIYSMLSVRMFIEDDDLRAGLNLYSTAIDAFDESDETTAILLATHGALAFTSARRKDKIDNLERALHSSRRIGIALGILMQSDKVNDEQAFDLLRIASQTEHRKLYEIAEDVIAGRALALSPAPVVRDRV